MQERLKIINFISDLGGCYEYRCRIPLDALARYGVVWQAYSFLPVELSNPNNFELLVNMISSFDLVIVSRCYLLSVVEKVRQACSLLGKALIFESDDDYLSIIPSNPCYFSLADQSLFTTYTELQTKAQQLHSQGKLIESSDCLKKCQEMIPSLLESRQKGLNEYVEILKMVDGITVSTSELACTMYPYNKNIQVFQNNVQFCYPWKLEAPESAFIKEVDGTRKVVVNNRLGLYTIPKFTILEGSIRGIKSYEVKKTPRVLYTCTASHWGEDWNTIVDGVNKTSKKLQNKAWWVFLGDNDHRFSKSITGDPGRVLTLQGSGYEMYRNNTLNGDIGLAPLAPTAFNSCKSDVKAIEYASCRVAPLLPRYITYMRNFRENDTCLAYGNENEFCEKLELLITNSKVRDEIAENALKYVIRERLSWLEKNTLPRYEFYKSMVENTPRLKIFKKKELAANV